MLCIVVMWGLWSSAAMADKLDVIAVSGGTAPGTGFTYGVFDLPVVNDAGEVAFQTNLETSEGVLYRATRDQAAAILRNNQVMPGLSGKVSGGTEPAINARGQVAFLGTVAGTSDVGVYRGDGSTVTEIARTGNTADPTVSDVYADEFSLPLINRDGHVAFRALLGGSNGPAGVYRSDGTQTYRVARTGPGFALDTVGKPTGMTNSGLVAFRGHRAGDNWDTLYRASGASTSLGDPLFPHGSDVTTPGNKIVEVRPGDISDPLMANTTRVAFNALTAEVNDNDFPTGALHVNRSGHLQALALGDGFGSEEPSPFGPVWNNVGVEAINIRAQTLYRGSIRGPAPSSFQGDIEGFAGGVFLSGPKGWRLLIETTTPLQDFGFGAPNIEGMALSEGGHVAFSANDNTDNAIFMIDANPEVPTDRIYQVARDGQPLLGSTITDLKFVKEQHTPRGLRAGPTAAVAQRSGVNKRGQVAFWYELADGRTGIALWSPPRMEQVTDGTFDLGLFRWATEGAGSAIAVDLDQAKAAIEMAPGSPITINQQLDTPDMAFDIAFDYRFGSSDGILEVLLDGVVVASLDGSQLGPMGDFATESLRLNEMKGLQNTTLAFTFDGPSDATIQLDNVSLRAIPEPATMSLLALGGLGALLRRQR